MLGGCAGGGMAFVLHPAAQHRALAQLPGLMRDVKRTLQDVVPFAIEPVVYRWALNRDGSVASLATDVLLPAPYYALHALHTRPSAAEAALVARAVLAGAEGFAGLPRAVFDRVYPPPVAVRPTAAAAVDEVLQARVEQQMAAGLIGLRRNRLAGPVLAPAVGEVPCVDETHRTLGEAALAQGRVAVVVLAGGLGTRWNGGARTVKALHPFTTLGRVGGRWWSFLDLHVAKLPPRTPLVVTTSHLTHRAVADWAPPHVLVSPSTLVGHRLVPTDDDLRLWFEANRCDTGDERKNAAQAQCEAALLRWAHAAGPATRYDDPRDPEQALHPRGHWHELPTALSNGTLAALLRAQPQVDYLLLHNCDTVGAHVDAALLGHHMASGRTLTWEVMERLADDRGGGVARVGSPHAPLRIVEGLALPRDEDELALPLYSTNTTWISVTPLLEALGLSRAALLDGPAEAVDAALAAFAARLPTYVTIKYVQRRWAVGQADQLPLAQCETLWGDASAHIDSGFVRVSRERGQQLKDVGQLDGWMRDGGMAYVARLVAEGAGQ